MPTSCSSDPTATPLHRVLSDEIGEVFRRLHADHGVTLRLGTGVAELRGTDRVEQVVLSDGRIEAADVVVIGVGVVSRVELAVAAGLKVDDGRSGSSIPPSLLVSSHDQAASSPYRTGRGGP